MRPILFLVISLILSSPIFSQKPSVARQPSWIASSQASYNPGSTKLLKDASDGYINLIHQVQINVGARTTYRRTVKRIVSAAGVQNASEVSVTYDPAYQRLLFHKIAIIRDGKTFDKLDLSKIKTVQEETELDLHLYNGTVRSVLFLEDVRKGDIIEYAYSIQGFNPIFKDKFCDEQWLQYGAPIGQLLYRIICPSGRDLTIQSPPNTPAPEITTQGPDKIYQWSLNDVSALRRQDQLPSWYSSNPTVRISEFPGWVDVNKWACSLFIYNHPPSPDLRKKIEEIKTISNGDKEKEIVNTLRFVQDEVRYMGIEMGVNSYKPNDPDKIFARRFGDCKDKSFLLCTMLRAMDIDASPVLINTTDKQELKNTPASAVAFDHCTVRVRLENKTYWFDPTISFQRGAIGDIAYPDYRCGLVLTDTTTGLTDIPLQDHGQVVANEKFTISEEHGPVKMEVVTIHTGSFADEIREEVNNNPLSDLQQSYLDFYRDYYDGIKVADSLRVDDDETSGKVTTHEFYTIDKLWSAKDDVFKAPFDGILIHSLIKKPKEHDRTMPIGLTYPTNYIEDLQISMPEDGNMDDPYTEIRSSSFLFKRTIETAYKKVHIRFEYQTLKDHVPASEAPKFFADCEKVESKLGYDLVQDYNKGYSPKSRGFSVSDGLAKALVCLALLGAIVYFVRRR